MQNKPNLASQYGRTALPQPQDSAVRPNKPELQSVGNLRHCVVVASLSANSFSNVSKAFEKLFAHSEDGVVILSAVQLALLALDFIAGFKSPSGLLQPAPSFAAYGSRCVTVRSGT